MEDSGRGQLHFPILTACGPAHDPPPMAGRNSGLGAVNESAVHA